MPYNCMNALFTQLGHFNQLHTPLTAGGCETPEVGQLIMCFSVLIILPRLSEYASKLRACSSKISVPK